MKVLVTGGTGFIGYNLVARLKKENHDVTCLVRESSDIRWLNSLGDVKFVYGDLLQPASLAAIMDEFDWVFHLAGVVTAVTREDYFRVNHLGTRNLIDAVAKHNPDIRKFVFVSSLAAGGPSSIDRPRDESMPDQPITYYGESKRAAEFAIKDYKDSIPLVIARPPTVYGPLDDGVFIFFRAIQKGWQIKFTGEDLYLSLIYVEDLTKALLTLAEADIPSGERFYVSDHYQYSMDQIQTMIAHAIDADTRKLHVPRALMYPVAAVSELFIRARNKPSFLNLQKIKEMTQTAWICSSEKLTNMTGFQAQYGLPDGAHKTAEWYKSHGWL